MYKVLGIEKFSGKDGRLWANLYLCFSDDKVEGLKCDKIFVSQSILPRDLKVNSNISIWKDLNNKISQITIK